MRKLLPLAGVLCALCAATARADIIFSDVVIDGDMGTPSVFTMQSYPYVDSISFKFSDPAVGDDYAPRREAQVTISYTAHADTGKLLSGRTLRAGGELLGSGVISISDQIDDVFTPGEVGSYSVDLDAGSILPHVAGLTFSRPAAEVRLTETITIRAPDSGDLDLAALGVITHTFQQIPVPEPASLVLFAATVAVLARRR